MSRHVWLRSKSYLRIIQFTSLLLHVESRSSSPIDSNVCWNVRPQSANIWKPHRESSWRNLHGLVFINRVDEIRVAYSRSIAAIQPPGFHIRGNVYSQKKRKNIHNHNTRMKNILSSRRKESCSCSVTMMGKQLNWYIWVTSCRYYYNPPNSIP